MLLVFGAPGQLPSLAGREHGRPIPLADMNASARSRRRRFLSRQRRAVPIGLIDTDKTGPAIAIARSCVRSGARGRLHSADLLGKPAWTSNIFPIDLHDWFFSGKLTIKPTSNACTERTTARCCPPSVLCQRSPYRARYAAETLSS